MANYASGQDPFGGGGVSSGQDPFADTETVATGQDPFEKKRLRGQTDAPVREDASMGTAIAARATTLPSTIAGGAMEMAGDQLVAEQRGYEQILVEGLREGLRPGQAVPAIIETGKALTKKFLGSSEAEQEVAKNLQGAGAELGDTAREERRLATPTDLNMLQRAGLSIADSSIQMAPWLVLGRAGVSRGLVRTGAIEAGALGQFGAGTFADTYNEAKAHGAAPEDAFKAAIISGGSEVLTEKLGLDVLLKEGGKKFLKFAANEIGGEEIATIVQSLTEKGLYNPDKWSSPGEVLGDLAETALAAAGGAGAIHTVDKYGLQRLEKKREDIGEQAQAAQAELETTMIERVQAAQGLATPPTDFSTALAAADPLIGTPLSPEEEAYANLVEAQRSGRISQEPTPEAQAYAAQLDEAVAGTHAQSEGQQAAVDAATEALTEASQDIGGEMSPEVLARKAETAGAYSSALPISKRAIGLVEGLAEGQNVEGLTIGQLGPTPLGSVVVPDWNQEAVPMHVARPIAQTVREWTQKYMPDARVILNFEQLGENEYGWHKAVEGADGIMTHIINPMEFPSAKYGGDAKTVTSLITALSHEFGHALIADSLGRQLQAVMGPASAEIGKEISRGKLSDASIAALQANGGVDAKMILDWQNQRNAVLNGTMTAREFMDSWVGTRKFAEDVAKQTENQRRYSWAEKQLGKDIDAASALELVQAVSGGTRAGVNQYLSLKEYAAEQFSRYAYAKGDVTSSAYGNWFTDAMNRLKGLFRTLKAEHIIAPSVTFSEWVDSTRAFNRKHAKRGTNPLRQWKISPELLKKQQVILGKQEKAKALQEEMRAAQEELAKEQKAAEERAAEAKKVKEETKAKAQKKETRTKKETAQARAIEIVDEEVAPLYALMSQLSAMTLAERRAKLAEYPLKSEAALRKLGADKATIADYLAKRQMIQDSIREMEKGAVESAGAPVETPMPKAKPAPKGKMGSKKAEAITEPEPAPEPEQDLTAEQDTDVAAADAEIKQAKSRKKASYIGQKKAHLTADMAEKHAELTGLLAEWAHLLTDAQVTSIQAQLDVGQFESAERRIMKVVNDQASFDREVSSRAVRELGKNREVYTAKQLEQVLRASGYRRTELEFWQNFMLQNPGGFTRDQMIASLTERQLPLVEHVFTLSGNNMVNWGVHGDGLGYDPNDADKTYRVSVASWQLPKDFVTAPDPHWDWETDNSVMHTRRIDTGALRYVMELQSAYYQTQRGMRPGVRMRPEVEDTLTAKQLEERIRTDKDYLDTLQKASDQLLRQMGVTDRMTEIGNMQSFIMEDQERLAALETPEAKAIRQEREIVELPRIVQQMENLEMRWLEDLVEREVGSAFNEGKAEILFPTQETADKVQGWDTLKPEELGRVQAARRRYKDLATLLKRYDAVLTTDEHGNSWWSVFPADFGDSTVSFDRDNPLNTESMPNALTSATAGLGKSTVKEGLAQWDANHTGSPMFRRWFGESQVTTPDGLAQPVWRSMGQRVTMANSAVKGYWFSAVPGVGYQANGVRTVEDGKAQRVGQFFLKIENPLIVEADGQAYEEEQLDEFTKTAYLAGMDGVIIRNMGGVQTSDQFLVFSTEQVVSNVDAPSIEDVDTVNWDRDNTSQAVKGVVKGLKNFANTLGISARIGQGWAKLTDNLIQIQQRAHTSPDEIPLQNFAKISLDIQEFKNRLQADADGFVKQDVQMLNRTDPTVVSALEKLLRFEATVSEDKEAEQYGVPVYQLGETILNQNGERLTQQMLMTPGLTVSIEVDARGRKAIADWASGSEVGWTDKDAERLDTLINRYQTARSIIATQMLTLGQSLAKNAVEKFKGQGVLARRDIGKTLDAIAPLIHQPFTPQGNFGNYVLTVTQPVPGATFGGPGPKRETILREHFESKVERDKAYAQWVTAARGTLGLKVTQKDLTDDELRGLPMQLPKELLERIQATEEFTRGQLDLLEELMVGNKVNALTNRFKKIGKVQKGSSTDLTRTFADFTWRNSNYIWKVHFGNRMRSIIKSARAELRQLQRAAVTSSGAPVAEIQKQIDWKNRNLGLMVAARQYMLNPGNEFQGIRTLITMVYLAYNIKTAFMNFSTNMNTYVAVTARMGELRGNKAYGKALKNASWLLANVKGKAEIENAIVMHAQGEMTAEELELVQIKERAIRDGILDQSYAYYLAAHANQNLANSLGVGTGKLGGVIKRGGQLAHSAMEVGMYGFQFVEKVNRTISLLTFYEMAKAEGMPMELAYQEAVRQTNLLQNDYTAGNRPKIMRGGKALFTIFQGYAQFMGWIMTGGYERGERMRAQSEGRNYAPAYRGPTVKLWLMYLALAGAMGVPFAQNLMDLLQVVWRKQTGGNLDADMREFLREHGLDANLVQHGIMHNFFGMDLSGSLGMGRLFPGTDTMSKRSNTAGEFFGNLMLSMTGVFGNAGKSVWEMGTAAAKGQGIGAVLSKAPGEIGYIGKLLDAYVRQSLRPDEGAGIVTKGDARLLWDERTKTFRDLRPAELGMMLLGANPTARSEAMQRQFAATTERMYWDERRADLTERYNRAKMAGDKDAVLITQQDIADYNKQVPNSKMRISGKDLRVSFKAHEKAAGKVEKYGTTSKKLRSVVGDVREEY